MNQHYYDLGVKRAADDAKTPHQKLVNHVNASPGHPASHAITEAITRGVMGKSSPLPSNMELVKRRLLSFAKK